MMTIDDDDDDDDLDNVTTLMTLTIGLFRSSGWSCSCLPVGGRGRCGRFDGCRRCCLLLIDTWLILPAIICLFKRLSHACLSISRTIGETANGSLYQLQSTRFIKLHG